MRASDMPRLPAGPRTRALLDEACRPLIAIPTIPATPLIALAHLAPKKTNE